MPTVSVRDRRIDCEANAVLRDVLLAAGISPHNGGADVFNCGGLGTCGTCAVAVTGATDEPGRRERARLSIPPHDIDSGLRLACRTRVRGDLTVRKYPGLWGQHTDRDPR